MYTAYTLCSDWVVHNITLYVFLYVCVKCMKLIIAKTPFAYALSISNCRRPIRLLASIDESDVLLHEVTCWLSSIKFLDSQHLQTVFENDVSRDVNRELWTIASQPQCIQTRQTKTSLGELYVVGSRLNLGFPT